MDDPLLLSRVQFAFTIAFHILFPSLTIGLAWFLVALEAAWLRTREEAWFRLYRFWARIFALAFGVGVVTGIVISFQFGTNWSGLVQTAGEVLGPLLGYEVLTAFFLEAGFLGVMLFGWNRVSPKVHFFATAMVALGTAISAFWILAANSWMQTPTGYVLEGGKILVADWWAVIFNPSFPYRFSHMLVAAFLATAFAVAGVAAWQLLAGRHVPTARRSLSLSLWMAAALAPLQVVLGDLHGLNTVEHQPIKIAAMEALWETQAEAPLLLFAWPDEAAERNRAEIAIPGAASLILGHDTDAVILGLKEVPADDRPPVAIVFFAFRIMVGAGVVMVVVALAGLWLRWRGRLHESDGLLRACVAASPLGFVAILAGWTVTEVGRQPWLVQDLARTADMVAPTLTAPAVWSSLGPFLVLYNLLLLAFLYYLYKLVQAGPDYEEPLPEALAAVGALTSWLPQPGRKERR